MNVRATDKHLVLCTQQYKPYDFATQIALNMDNAWGIVRCIIDYLKKQPEGKYIIMKDPNKVGSEGLSLQLKRILVFIWFL